MHSLNTIIELNKERTVEQLRFTVVAKNIDTGRVVIFDNKTGKMFSLKKEVAYHKYTQTKTYTPRITL